MLNLTNFSIHPQLLEKLYKHTTENEITNDVNIADDHWESSELDPESISEKFDSIPKLTYDWLNKEEMKRKRTHRKFTTVSKKLTSI